MKILFIRATLHDTTEAIPRAMEVCADICDEVEILCWNRLGSDLPRTEVRHGTRIRRFQWKSPSRSVGVLIGTFCYLFWLAYHILRIRPQLIQALDFESMVAVHSVRWIVGARAVYDMRDPVAYCYNFPAWLRMIVYALDWCVIGASSAIVIPSPERRGYLGLWGRGRKPIATILNVCPDELATGVPFLKQSSDCRESSSQDATPVQIGYVGYLSPSRGGFLLLDLCEALAGAVRLRVAGKLRFPALRERIENSPHAEFLGHLPRREALNLMRQVDVVSLLYDPGVPVNRIAAPNKFYEALCMGTPVLVNRGMSLAETVEEAGLGWVVDYDDQAQLRRVIEEIQDREKHIALRSRCREYYLRYCNFEEQMAIYRQFYRDLVPHAAHVPPSSKAA